MTDLPDNEFLPVKQGVPAEDISDKALTKKLDGLDLTPGQLFEIRVLLEAREYNKDRLEDILEAQGEIADGGDAWNKYIKQIQELIDHGNQITKKLKELGYV